ncbi:hypothetical protein ASG28_10855 [Frigoribacterium sp. Leaf415]|nr:hypothetical protein ASF07_10845 [Frigoribacterium sp. Leaf254]KQT39988.1 hypothetical protein ASG28_10855 [Frigoribacterium sp. Leaf415]
MGEPIAGGRAVNWRSMRSFRRQSPRGAPGGGAAERSITGQSVATTQPRAAAKSTIAMESLAAVRSKRPQHASPTTRKAPRTMAASPLTSVLRRTLPASRNSARRAR